MRIAITGAGGLIGSALRQTLAVDGHDVVRLVRTRDGGKGTVFWDPAAGVIEAAELEGLDAVIHLSGETVAGRWTRKKKEKIRSSRIESTLLLSKTLAGLESRPRVLVCASAVGYYGDRGDEELTERSDPGSGFLAGVVRAWEAATVPATRAGIRVVNVRSGIVLSRKGGALATMLLPFRLGIGGRLGSGDQWMSWISLDDEVAGMVHALTADGLAGPVNLTSPNPVTNREFTKTLGRVLRRPTVLPVPAPALRLLAGEFAREGLLAGQRVYPMRLEASGFTFTHPQLEDALENA